MTAENATSWSDWLAATSASPTSQDQEVTAEQRSELEELLVVPKPMSRSITVAQLRCAAGLVRDGYCSEAELARLDRLVSSTLGGRSSSRSSASVAAGLLALAEKNVDASWSGIWGTRGVIEVGLMGRETRGVQYESASRTAKLCRRLGECVTSGGVDPRLCERLLADSGLLCGNENDEAAARLLELERRCVATAQCARSSASLHEASLPNTLSRAEMLQLKHVVHCLATTYLSPFRPGGPALDESRAENKTEGRRSMDSLADSLWQLVQLSKFTTAAPRPPRRFGLGQWLEPADAARAYEAACACREPLRLSASPRVWCVSDIHADVAVNRAWVEQLEARPEDAIIVAGDVATSLQTLAEVLTALNDKYKHVFFVPGNHELWIDSVSADCRHSVDKFFRILELCDELQVHTELAFLGELLVVPLFSWYRRVSPDAGMLEYFDMACTWPWARSSLDDRVADFFSAINESAIEAVNRLENRIPILSFSHFVPRVNELFPGFETFRNVMGCRDLDDAIERINPRVFVFGHSHINVDELVGHTRFVQNALGHPSDHNAEAATLAPLLIWTTSPYHVATSSSTATPTTATISPDESIHSERHAQIDTCPPLTFENFAAAPSNSDVSQTASSNDLLESVCDDEATLFV